MEEKPNLPAKPEIIYQVMPRSSKPNITPAEIPSPPLQQVSSPQSTTVVPPISAPAEKSFMVSKIGYVIIAIVVLGALGGLAYYLLGTKKSAPQPQPQPQQQSTSKLTSAWLQQYFGKAVCDDQNVCGDAAVPEIDGLTNYDEFVAGTNPTIADTDSDGLADGDEVHVYKTDPIKKYTDTRAIAMENDYNDGISIRNGYDPLTPGSKMTATRLQQIQADTQTFGLHEPTKTTLQQANTTTQNTTNQPIINNPNAKSWAVSINNNALPSITVNAGDTVVWLNKDTTAHHLVSDLPMFESADLADGQTFNYTFVQAGVYKYHDKLNASATGTITVN